MGSFFIVLFVGFSCTLFLNWAKKTLLSISGIFVILWTITLSLSCLGLYKMNPPSFEVVLLGIISIIIFTIAGIVGGSKRNKYDIIVSFGASYKQLSNNKLLYILSFASYVYIYPFLRKSLSLLANYGLSYLRDYTTSSTEYASTAQAWILSYFVQSIYIVTILVVCIDIVNGTPFLPSIIISLVDVVSYALLFGGRYIFLYVLVFLGFLLLFKYNSKISLILHQYKKVVFLLLLVVLVMIWVTLQRSRNSFLKSLYVYFCGSYSYLSLLIDEKIITDFYFLGLNQIGFIYNFVYAALKVLFDIDYNGTNHILSQVTQYMVSIGEGVKYNSLGTFLVSCIADFGIWFSFIGVAIYAVFLNYLENLYIRKRTKTTLCLYLMAIFWTINTVFSYSLGSPSCLIIMILIYVLCNSHIRIRDTQ